MTVAPLDPPGEDIVSFAHASSFRLQLPLNRLQALEFVRDVPRSLRYAEFLTDLRLEPGEPPLVSAALPVSAALFGRHDLPFASELHHQLAGASLRPLPLTTQSRGWAELGGEVEVATAGSGSRVDYSFDVTVHLRLPAADRWGTRALTKMIELTAASLLQKLMVRFPAAIERAANET